MTKMTRYSLRLFFCFSLALFAGCQTKVWDKPDATEADFNSDLQDATMRASFAVGPVPTAPVSSGIGGAIAGGLSHGLRRNELVKQYMFEKGWRLVPKSSN